MFMNNNQISFDELNFFQDYSARDMKFQRTFSNERYTHPFYDNGFDNIYDFGQPKWNSFPNCLTSVKKNQQFKPDVNKIVEENEQDDNSSNLADTEEHITLPVELEKDADVEKTKIEITKELDTNEHSFDSIKFNERDVGELLDMINHPTTDMNALLSEVLTAGPTDPEVKRKRAITKKVKGKRVRKTKKQIDALTEEYERNSNWNSEEINRLAAQLGLTKKQVYKWYWDQRISQGETKHKHW